MVATASSVTLPSIYQTVWYHIPEDFNFFHAGNQSSSWPDMA